MRAIPMHLRAANAFVCQHHRHSDPVVGSKFCFAVEKEGRVVGVVIVGRPIARMEDDGLTAEVLRVCTDGTRNACSFLYARAAKIARLMGYEAVITTTLDEESGSSLLAIGARRMRRIEPEEWSRTSRPRHSQAVYQLAKWKWLLP